MRATVPKGHRHVATGGAKRNPWVRLLPTCSRPEGPADGFRDRPNSRKPPGAMATREGTPEPRPGSAWPCLSAGYYGIGHRSPTLAAQGRGTHSPDCSSGFHARDKPWRYIPGNCEGRSTTWSAELVAQASCLQCVAPYSGRSRASTVPYEIFARCAPLRQVSCLDRALRDLRAMRAVAAGLVPRPCPTLLIDRVAQ